MAAIRFLGVVGIAGGTVLLIAFLPSFGIPSDLNTWRLVLFDLGAIAVAVAAYRVGALGSSSWSWATLLAAVATNVAHLAFTVIATTRDAPFAADFGLAWHWVAFAMWLSDALLGVALLRTGVLSRWGAAALAIGSPLAVLGMGRFELTSPTNPTIFGPIALLGVALNGIGWVLLGLDLIRSTTTERAMSSASLRPSR